MEKKCVKLIVNTGQSKGTKILLGLIVSEDEFFLIFKTSKKEYRINRSCILLIEETDIDFVGVQNE